MNPVGVREKAATFPRRCSGDASLWAATNHGKKRHAMSDTGKCTLDKFTVRHEATALRLILEVVVPHQLLPPQEPQSQFESPALAQERLLALAL